MRLQLERFSYAPDFTQGRVFVYDGMVRSFIAWTIERPWQNNEPSVSCIPEGTYEMEPWIRPDGSQVFIVHGNSVCRTPDQLNADKTRCLILWHAGNTVDDVQGCICPGREYGPGVVYASQLAMQDLQSVLNPHFSCNQTIDLTILQGRATA